ncbi:MAG TPA: MoxR family ATPase [Pyrinomonadaceae bacterium]|jgi:MoxR-like ATPase
MTQETDFLYYAGDGTRATDGARRLPDYERLVPPDDPGGYRAELGLVNAVNAALMLGQPLLVTGEPGTGKTQLARSVAHELGLPEPLTFNTKTTSTARDLFYRYDSLAHFHDAQFRKGGDGGREALDVEKYITYEALGRAILLAMSPKEADPFLPPEQRGMGPVRSVVLIDEIDKAPRDLPNDVLNEIVSMSFTVRETGRTFSAPGRYRPIVILTSNAEKNLPEPLLRRCVFYYIKFPDDDSARLAEIVRSRLGEGDGGLSGDMLSHALTHFLEIRTNKQLRKPPATAELLAWLRVLGKRGIDAGNPSHAAALASTYPVLLKYKDDLDAQAARRQAPA